MKAKTTPLSEQNKNKTIKLPAVPYSVTFTPSIMFSHTVLKLNI